MRSIVLIDVKRNENVVKREKHWISLREKSDEQI